MVLKEKSYLFQQKKHKKYSELDDSVKREGENTLYVYRVIVVWYQIHKVWKIEPKFTF